VHVFGPALSVTAPAGLPPFPLDPGADAIPAAWSAADQPLVDVGTIAAPGGSILSATLRETIGEPFAVFDGTSMAAPHVTGAVALLLQRHPLWSAQQVKSALMSTAGPAWGDTGRTTEASVPLEGAGLIDVGRADDPKVFTEAASLSFRYLDVTGGAVARPLVARISDAGGGYGTWQVELQPQAATAGASLDLPPPRSASRRATPARPPTGRAPSGSTSRSSRSRP
jgi:subtilisin family serine protease